MKKRTRSFLFLLTLLALLAAIACTYVLRHKYEEQQRLEQGKPQSGDERRTVVMPENIALPPDSDTTEQPSPSGVPEPAVEDPEESSASPARQAMRQGLALLADQEIIQARGKLSEAVLSGKLSAPEEAEAVRQLAQLADATILSRDVYPDDPYVTTYTFAPGDVLQRVERKLELHVPHNLLMQINGITDAAKIRAGQTLKMIKGPFHAVVTKHNFTMDLYLHREGLQPVFVKRVKVGLGKNGSTPLGMWRVALGKKMVHAPWNPPPNSQHLTTILWGEPGYPLGAEGYWISLEGTDENTAPHQGYGLHGTNEPDSIGKEQSLGCIRLADPDIELVFFCLYENWSTVEIRP